MLASFVQNVNDVISSPRRSILALPEVARRSLEEHGRILDAVEARDPAPAMLAGAEHIESTRERIARLIEDENSAQVEASPEPTRPSSR